MSRVAWVGLILASVAAIVVVLVHASARAVNLSSTYDGADPVTTKCSGSAVDVPRTPRVQIKRTDGSVVGTVGLRRSEFCGAIWGQVILTPEAGRALRGRTMLITARRPADNQITRYRLPLRGGTKGFGNMLATSACVEVTAQIEATRREPAGPTAKTACRQ